MPGDGIEVRGGALIRCTDPAAAGACSEAFWKSNVVSQPPRRAKVHHRSKQSPVPPSSWPYGKDQLFSCSAVAAGGIQSLAPPIPQASCCLLDWACSGHGRPTVRERGQHVASPAALHGTTRSLPHCCFHLSNSPFDLLCVRLTCHWLS